LQLVADRAALSHTAAGSDRANRRLHLRRGHLRRLKHKTVWV
jgi:hypothetical protein